VDTAVVEAPEVVGNNQVLFLLPLLNLAKSLEVDVLPVHQLEKLGYSYRK